MAVAAGLELNWNRLPGPAGPASYYSCLHLCPSNVQHVTVFTYYLNY